MDQLIQSFGLDARLIAVQIVNFAIVLGALWYFLYGPVMRILRERQEKIEQGLTDAEAAEKAKQAAEEQKQEILSAAHHEAEAVSARAEKAAEAEKATIIASAEEKAATVVSAAEQRGEEIKTQAQKESDAEVAKTAVLAAEKILRERKA